MTARPESLYEEMKRYVRFSEADTRALATFHTHAAPRFERIAIEFYDRIREHERAHDVFKDEAQVERLKKSLVRWLHRIFTGPYDQAFFEETAKIGRVHVRVGLDQHYMLTAMALIRLALERIALETMGREATPTAEAVHRVLDLELAVMLGAYQEDHVARIQRLDRLERERVDRTLAQTEHRYQHAVELARVLIVGLDARATVRLYNREAERVTGLGRDEVLGTPFAALIPEALRDEHGALFARAAGGDGPTEGTLESAVRTRSGKVRDVRWQLAYASAMDDEVVLFAVGQDTTDENALAARVRQTEKLAAVGTLAAGLAHEIRNPLNGAQLHLTFLGRGLRRAGVTDPDTHEAVRVVGEEIRRLSELTTEFLDFARPKPLDKRVCSVRALCERAAQLVSGAAEAGGVRVGLDLPDTDIEVEVDGDKIQQVLLNVLQNAVEATTTSGGVVTVRMRRQPRRVVIEIEDDGPGLPSAEAPVFDAFFSTKPNGTGLGLAIAHRIVTDHGGEIDVTSQPGRTIFRIALPVRLSS
ncbi:Sensor protein of zinc sigma-54-dependent two-component system [Minicystis rosea]|nr:Sensor protein of zinc sigma-54-dependent two-component system [Minicystis rosea]